VRSDEKKLTGADADTARADALAAVPGLSTAARPDTVDGE
jgi:hypothetical protein